MSNAKKYRIIPQYSGFQSGDFWAFIGTFKGVDHDAAYLMGCALQDVEGRVMQFLKLARKRKLKRKK